MRPNQSLATIEWEGKGEGGGGRGGGNECPLFNRGVLSLIGTRTVTCKVLMRSASGVAENGVVL